MRSGSAQATRSGFCERAGAGHRPPPKCVGFCDKSGEDAWISWDATEGHLPQRQTDLIYATTCAGTASLKKGVPGQRAQIFTASKGHAAQSAILNSSSTGGFSSCPRQPVAAKQRIRSMPGSASSRRKLLKSGGSFQSKNSENGR